MACAMTGSGKTVAFLLPILHHLIGKSRGVTRALVLTPTRELAAQILEDLNDVAVHTPINGAAVYGGVGMGPQEHAIRSGVDVIIATPGRLLDHFGYPYAKLGGLEFLVLDEADRMLDMGFLPDIRRILRHIPKRRQTLFFSATMPAPIAELARQMLHNPVTINLGRQSGPAVGITQAVYPVAQELKAALLAALLQRGDLNDALVFTRTKHRADRVAHYLVKCGIAAERIHGNRSQNQRTLALAGFKSGKHQVLVATDIAARGIDVEALGHVVNLRRPQSTGGLHPPRRPDGARRVDRRRLHVRVSPGGTGPRPHRARDPQAAPTDHCPRLRLPRAGRSPPGAVERRAPGGGSRESRRGRTARAPKSGGRPRGTPGPSRPHTPASAPAAPARAGTARPSRRSRRKGRSW